MQKPLMTYKPLPAQVPLYCPNFVCTVTVPRNSIEHMPAQRLNITRLVACKNFSEAVAEAGGARPDDEQWCANACKMGNRCKFVHVSRPLSEFPSQALHAHYIWRSVEDVTYDRLLTGATSAETPNLRVSHYEDCRDQLIQYRQMPQEDGTAAVHVLGGDVDLHQRAEPGVAVMVDVIAAVLPSVRVPATRLLATEGAVECLRLAEAGKPVPDLPLCPHYSCENECRYGSKCRNAHVINVDTSLQAPFVRRSIRNVKDAMVAVEIVAHLDMPRVRSSPTSYTHNPYFVVTGAKPIACVCEAC